MSNAADDPGHRPQPPGPGEPRPYPGGPYQGDPYYQGDPQAYPAPQYPAGPSYQGGGYATPPPYPAPPADPAQYQGGYGTAPALAGQPAGRDRSFVGALFDLNFDHMVTPRLIKGSYFFAVVLSTLVAIVWLIVGVWLFHYGYLLTVFIVLFTPPAWLASLITTRIALEFVINQFKITEHLKAIREQREPR